MNKSKQISIRSGITFFVACILIQLFFGLPVAIPFAVGALFGVMLHSSVTAEEDEEIEKQIKQLEKMIKEKEDEQPKQ